MVGSRDKHVKPVTPPRLNPVFGVHCRTQSFAIKNTYQSHHIYLEAYQDSPRAKTWTVRRIHHINDGHKPHVRVDHMFSGTSFDTAMNILAREEADLRRRTASDTTPLYPPAAAMGFAHFKAFAEREGFVFDTRGIVHARPGPGLLPSEGLYAPEDIASADKHVQRSAADFHGEGDHSKTPSALFIFDNFNRVAQKRSLQEELAEIRVLDILNRFVNAVETVARRLETYCADPADPSRTHLISEAEDALKLANLSLRQLQAYGIETKEFESFTKQCEVSVHVVHAQGLFVQLKRQSYDHDFLERYFRARVHQAHEAYKTFDATADGLTHIQQLCVQDGTPTPPAALRFFIDNYRNQRAGFNDTRAPASLPPKPPAP